MADPKPKRNVFQRAVRKQGQNIRANIRGFKQLPTMMKLPIAGMGLQYADQFLSEASDDYANSPIRQKAFESIPEPAWEAMAQSGYMGTGPALKWYAERYLPKVPGAAATLGRMSNPISALTTLLMNAAPAGEDSYRVDPQRFQLDSNNPNLIGAATEQQALDDRAVEQGLDPSVFESDPRFRHAQNKAARRDLLRALLSQQENINLPYPNIGLRPEEFRKTQMDTATQRQFAALANQYPELMQLMRSQQRLRGAAKMAGESFPSYMGPLGSNQ